MASLFIKKFSNLNLINVSKKLPISVLSRSVTTNNEQLWVKENSLKLIEQAKNEIGPKLDIDLKKPQLYFEKSEELKNADEVIKKILSLEFANRNDFKRYEQELLKRTFQRLPTEHDSLEIQIAFHTQNIRRMCQNMEDFKGKNKRVEFFLYRQIHRRDRLMVQLFYKDNKRYEWLKEKLNLQDYELKETQAYKRVTRYEKYINQVKSVSEEKRADKLNSLKNQFENEKVKFFNERDKILLDIQNEIKDLGFSDLQFPELTKNV